MRERARVCLWYARARMLFVLTEFLLNEFRFATGLDVYACFWQ